VTALEHLNTLDNVELGTRTGNGDRPIGLLLLCTTADIPITIVYVSMYVELQRKTRQVQCRSHQLTRPKTQTQRCWIQAAKSDVLAAAIAMS
jgi:H2-forming N5,N10-methylenetetrahydromethanopterin dehydrogenase-like enzyme